jgi:broad specificity phosphatase PhoE
MNLYLIRHADSAIPEDHIQNDFPLSELGKRQVMALAQRMNSLRIDYLFSSPLIRARDTAEFISKSHSVPIRFETNFREMDLGHMAGMSRQEMMERYGGFLRSYPYPKMEYAYANGETPEQFHARVAASLEKAIWLPFHREDVNVVLVAHGGVICAILLHFLGLRFDGYLTFFVDWTGISKIDARHGRPRIRYINDTSHLGELKLI